MYIDIILTMIFFFFAIHMGYIWRYRTMYFMWISAQYLPTPWTTKENILLLKWNQFGIAEKLTDTGLSAIQFCRMMYEHLYLM